MITIEFYENLVRDRLLTVQWSAVPRRGDSIRLNTVMYRVDHVSWTHSPTYVDSCWAHVYLEPID